MKDKEEEREYKHNCEQKRGKIDTNLARRKMKQISAAPFS